MTRRLQFLAMFLVVVALIVGIGVFRSEAVEYLGQVCLTADSGAIMKLGITHTGGGHLLLNGKLTGTKRPAPRIPCRKR